MTLRNPAPTSTRPKTGPQPRNNRTGLWEAHEPTEAEIGIDRHSHPSVIDARHLFASCPGGRGDGLSSNDEQAILDFVTTEEPDAWDDVRHILVAPRLTLEGACLLYTRFDAFEDLFAGRRDRDFHTPTSRDVLSALRAAA